jgi:hypothetical protein
MRFAVFSRRVWRVIASSAIAGFVPITAQSQQHKLDAAAEVVARYRAARVATMEQGAAAATVDVLLGLLTDSAVYEHPQAGARIVGRERIGAGIRDFLGATRRPRIQVVREIVTGSAVAAEERVTFEVEQGGAWVPRARTQLTVYFVQDGKIARELQYWAN